MRRNAVERSESGALYVSDILAPPPAEMVVYQQRYAEIQQGLARTDLDALKKRMGRLFLLFPVAGQAPGAAADMAEAYASVLARVPLWAVDKACQNVIASGATFRPSAPEILALAQEACRPIYEEAEALRLVIEAKPYKQNTATERERVKSGFNGLMRSLGPKLSSNPPPLHSMTKEEAKRRLEETRAQFTACDDSHLDGTAKLNPEDSA